MSEEARLVLIFNIILFRMKQMKDLECSLNQQQEIVLKLEAERSDLLAKVSPWLYYSWRLHN